MLDFAHIPVRAGERSTFISHCRGRTSSALNPRKPMGAVYGLLRHRRRRARTAPVMEIISNSNGALRREHADVGRLRQRLMASWPLKYQVSTSLAFYETTDDSWCLKPINIRNSSIDPSKQLPERVSNKLCNIDGTAINERENLVLISACARPRKPWKCVADATGVAFLPPVIVSASCAKRSPKIFCVFERSDGQQRPSRVFDVVFV